MPNSLPQIKHIKAFGRNDPGAAIGFEMSRFPPIVPPAGETAEGLAYAILHPLICLFKESGRKVLPHAHGTSASVLNLSKASLLSASKSI